VRGLREDDGRGIQDCGQPTAFVCHHLGSLSSSFIQLIPRSEAEEFMVRSITHINDLLQISIAEPSLSTLLHHEIYPADIHQHPAGFLW
jgi:hypothetical protein